MEVVGFVIGVLGPIQQAVEITQLIIETSDATRKNPKHVADLRHLYQAFLEKLQKLKQEYDGKECDLPLPIREVFSGHWKEMQQTFDNAKQVLTELHEKLQKRTVLRNFFRATSTAQKLEALTEDLRRADQRLAEVNAILATAAIIEKSTGRVMRYASGKLDRLSERIEQGFAGPSGQQRDCFRTCFIVPANRPDVTLNFGNVKEGTPPTREAAAKISVLKQKAGSPMITVLKGGGGLGKTCTLRGLARLAEVKDRFTHGVYYLSLGQDASYDTVIKEICKAIRLSGGRATAAALEKKHDLKVVVEEAQQWFQGKNFVVLADDVWNRHVVGSRVVSLLYDLVCAGEDSALVFTTRDGGIAKIANSVIEFEPREPLGPDARAILLSCAGFEESEVQDRASGQAVQKLLNICRGFPVMLAVAGKGVCELASKFVQAERGNAWVEYTEMACRENVVDKAVPGYEGPEYESLLSTVTTTLAVLKFSFKLPYPAWTLFQGLRATKTRLDSGFSAANRMEYVPGGGCA